MNKILWNGWLKFSYENFIVIATAAFLESNDLRFGSDYSPAENFCSLLAIVAMAYSVILPFIIFTVYWTSFKKTPHTELIGNSTASNVKHLRL